MSRSKSGQVNDDDRFEQIERLIRSVDRLSFGDVSTPSGMEAVTMALSGDPRKSISVANAILQVADALERIANVMEEKSVRRPNRIQNV